MYEEKPSIYHLPVHLEDKQTIYFDDDDLEALMDCDAIKKTPLTEWFVANATLEGANDITYHDFPQCFVWEKQLKKWKPHSQCDIIGKMYFVHPSAGKHFYIRLLLTTVTGAKFWEDVRRFGDELHPAYKAACFAHGLLEEDGKWKKCLEEAGNMHTGLQLHCLFAIILLHLQLWSSSHPGHPHKG